MNGATAVYAEVLPGVDLHLTATASGMSEVLVIASAQAATNPALSTLRLAIDGASVSSGPGEPIVATAPDGSTVMGSAPLWWDSSAEGASAGGPGETGEPRPVDHDASEGAVSLDLASSLRGTSPTYPIFVNPDWNAGAQNVWFNDRAFPNQTYLNGAWSDGHLSVGAGGSYLSHAFWSFDTGALVGRHILSAQFGFSVNGSFTCAERQFDVHHFVTTGPGFSWNGEPAHWGGVAGSVSLGCGYTTYGVDVTGVLAYTASVGEYPMQLGMRANNESDLLTRRHLDLGGSLTVRYNTMPSPPTSPLMSSPPRGCGTQASPDYVNGAQAIYLRATSSDPDGGNMSTRFFVVDGNTAVNRLPSATAPAGYLATPFRAGGTVSVQVPANTLPPGFYAWRASVSDGVDVGPASGWCWFQVKNTPPGLPTVTALTAATTVGAPMTVRFSSSLADKVAVFAYWWTNAASASPAAVPPIGSGPTAPACGQTWGSVTFVCADASGRSPAITVAPVDTTSTLWVAGYDRAGNVSTGTGATPDRSTGLTVKAAADPNVSYDKGHGWIMEGLTAPLGPTIPDANTASGSGLTAAAPLTVGAGTGTTESAVRSGLPDTPVLTLPGYVQLNRYSISVIRGMYYSAINGNAPSPWRFEQPLGQMIPYLSPAQPTPTGMQKVYSCALGGGTQMTSLSSSCEGTGVTGTPIGFSWTSAAAVPSGVPAVAVYRCHSGSDRFDSTSSTCEGASVDFTLGYFAAIAPTTTTGPVVDTTKSFTVSVWLRASVDSSNGMIYTALSQSGSVNSGFLLQQYGGYWRFCLQTQTGTAQLSCVMSAAPVKRGEWTLVTGVWDATNQQLRLLLGPSANPEAVAARAVVPGDVSANGPLLVGSALTNRSPAQQWIGDIDDPAVFPGVIGSDQLQNLYRQSPP